MELVGPRGPSEHDDVVRAELRGDRFHGIDELKVVGGAREARHDSLEGVFAQVAGGVGGVAGRGSP